VRIVSAFLANHVEIHNSKLYTHGGFPENWVIPELPCGVVLGVGVVVEIDPGELGQALAVEVVVRPSGGPDLAKAQVGFQRAPDDGHIDGAPYYMPLAWNIPVNLPSIGAYEVVVGSDGLTFEIVRFGVLMAR
jgi:hypothetical protein